MTPFGRLRRCFTTMPFHFANVHWPHVHHNYRLVILSHRRDLKTELAAHACFATMTTRRGRIYLSCQARPHSQLLSVLQSNRSAVLVLLHQDVEACDIVLILLHMRSCGRGRHKHSKQMRISATNVYPYRHPIPAGGPSPEQTRHRLDIYAHSTTYCIPSICVLRSRFRAVREQGTS